MIREIALVSVIAFLGAAPFPSQDAPPPKEAAFSVPPDLAHQANPVHPTAEAMAHARKMYGYDCAMCHGKAGAGDGDMAAQLKTKLKDYRDPTSLKSMTDGELFYIIQKGKGEMTGEGLRAKPDDLWNMVTLVRSFSKK